MAPIVWLLSSIWKHKKPFMCLIERIGELDKLNQVCNSSAIDHEFKVNELMIWHIQKNEADIFQSIPEAAPENVRVTSMASGKAMDS